MKLKPISNYLSFHSGQKYPTKCMPRQNGTFLRPKLYSQTNSYITDSKQKSVFPEQLKQMHSVAFRVGRRMNIQTDSCITAFVTHSIPTVNGFLDCSPHALSQSFRLCESPLLSLRHLPTNPSLFPCDFGSLNGIRSALRMIIQYCRCNLL